MLDWMRQRLRRTKIKKLPLAFALDRSDDGQHVVQVYKKIEGEDERITDIYPFWRYGYKEEVETPNGLVMYVVDEADQQTLLSLKSMNPKIDTNGRLLFDFAPPILNYLRTKPNIEETKASEKLTVSQKPIQPAIKVDFNPESGLHVTTGYQVEDSSEIIPIETVQTTAAGNYVLAGDTFTPLPQDLSQKAQEWLKQPDHQVSLDAIPEFFLRDLVLLKNEFTAVLTDLASEIQILKETLKPVIRVDRHEKGWLDFDVGYEVGDGEIPHKLLVQKRHEQFIQVDDTTWVKNDRRTIRKIEKQLRQLEAKAAQQGYRVPISQFASLEEFIQHVGGKPVLSAAYQEFLEQLTGFAADEHFQLSSEAEQRLTNVGITLRPYQRAGIHWLDWLFDNQLHGLLADDMGLGKTLQTICILRQAYERSATRQHSLILAPKSVLHHWERELTRFYPHLYVYRYHGSGRRQDLLYAQEPIAFISTYATVANDLDEISKVPFFYIILDEATSIKNPNTKRTQAVKALNSAHRLALSGMPVENRPAELWSIFDFLIRGHLGKYGTFSRLFEEQIRAGNNQASERLGQRIRPFMLRRMKSQVARDLPEKIEMDEWCDLTVEQQQLYSSLQEETKRLFNALRQGEQVSYTTSILPVLTKLKQICDHPAILTNEPEPLDGRSEKFDWIVDKIHQIVEEGEQVVVFSHFLGMLNLLQKSINQSQIPHIRLDGSTFKREALIDRFNQGHAKAALCSIKATGYGINLTAANHVIHADRWWNPATEDQATDRVYRIGQDKTVYVYRIMVEGTLEERIDILLSRKRDIANEIVGAAQGKGYHWSREELLELLKPID